MFVSPTCGSATPSLSHQSHLLPHPQANTYLHISPILHTSKQTDPLLFSSPKLSSMAASTLSPSTTSQVRTHSIPSYTVFSSSGTLQPIMSLMFVFSSALVRMGCFLHPKRRSWSPQEPSRWERKRVWRSVARLQAFRPTAYLTWARGSSWICFC